MKSKRQRRLVGGVVRIKLDKTWHTYGRILEEPLFAFYDSRVKSEINAESVVERPILFKIWVMNHAVTSGRWPIVEVFPLEPHLLKEPRFFKQDEFDASQVTLYSDSGPERPISRSKAAQLERAAVWEPEHVEDRLRDHYARRANKWVESLKLET